MAAAPSPTTGRTCPPRSTTSSTRGAPTFENPYDDLEGDDAGRNWDSDRRLAELEADGVVAEVIFPNTIPPFFPQASLVHQPPARRRRRPRPALGRAAGPQPLARRLLRRGARAGGPASRRSCCTTSTPRSPRCAGPRRPGSPAASCCRARRRARACRRCTRPTTSRSGRCARSSACRQPPQRQRVARLRRLPRGQGDVPVEVTWWAHRALWQLIYSRRDGAPPDAAVRVHRAGHGLDARAARHARLPTPTACRGAAGSQEHVVRGAR